jgi:hypothetical protein
VKNPKFKFSNALDGKIIFYKNLVDKQMVPQAWSDDSEKNHLSSLVEQKILASSRKQFLILN